MGGVLTPSRRDILFIVSRCSTVTPTAVAQHSAIIFLQCSSQFGRDILALQRRRSAVTPTAATQHSVLLPGPAPPSETTTPKEAHTVSSCFHVTLFHPNDCPAAPALAIFCPSATDAPFSLCPLLPSPSSLSVRPSLRSIRAVHSGSSTARLLHRAAPRQGPLARDCHAPQVPDCTPTARCPPPVPLPAM